MPAFFLPSPAFAGWPFRAASPCPLAETPHGVLAGASGPPVASDALTALSRAVDTRRQRYHDAWRALQRHPERPDQAARRAHHPLFPSPGRIGDFFSRGFPAWWRFQRPFVCLETASGALVRVMPIHFDLTQRGIRPWSGRQSGQKGGHPARHFRLPVVGNVWVTIPPAIGRWMQPWIPATTRSAWGRTGNSRSPELLRLGGTRDASIPPV